MTDHDYVQEHVAAYLAGGLDAAETERFEAHVRDCPTCSAALADARRVDQGLLALFAPDNPGPGLETRAVVRLQTAERPRLRRFAKWAMAAAALLALGTVGAVVGSRVSDGRLPMPGSQIRKEDLIAQRWLDEPPQILQGAHKQNLGTEDETQFRAADAEYRKLEQDYRNSDVQSQILAASQKNTLDELTANRQRLSIRDYYALRGSGYAGAMYETGIDSFNGRSVPGHTVNPTQPAPDSSLVSGAGFGPWDSNALAVPGLRQEDLAWAVSGAKARTELYKPRTASEVTANGLGPSIHDDPKPKEPKPPEPKEGQPPPPKAPADPKNPDPIPDPLRRIVIRSGDIEFEIESFDAATATVTKLVLGLKGAYISTVNSDKQPTGKVRGSITVRVPPDQLDALVLDLRRELGKGGELKSVKLASQDITKTYTDLESRLRAARTMEQRLLQIIKEGKGEIKALLEAERELGVWRTKIEEFEGELRYYSNLAAFSTLTVILTEREVRTPALATEREKVQAGVEVDEVDKAYQQLLAAVIEAKGRVIRSELKQLASGQFNAAVLFEVPHDSGGPLRDRLRMLGRVSRLDIDRTVQSDAGAPAPDAKPKRGDTAFVVHLYNLTNIPPRETIATRVAVADVPGAYQSLRDAVAKAAGRVMLAQLNEQDRQNVSAQFDFEVRRAEEAGVRAALESAGEAVSRQVDRIAATDGFTDAKVLYRVTLLSAGRLPPRETLTLAVEVSDVDGSATLFSAQVAEAKGRQVDARFERDARGGAVARLVFEVPLAAAAGVTDRFKSAGTIRTSQSTRDPQAPEGRYATARINVTLTNVEAIVPDDKALWPQVRRGLSLSASVLLTSVTWVVFGLCVVLPWAVLGLVGYRITRRAVRTAPPAAEPTVPASPAPAPAPPSP
jgi:hypothetical protein